MSAPLERPTPDSPWTVAAYAHALVALPGAVTSMHALVGLWLGEAS